jgi:hypothetical protein
VGIIFESSHIPLHKWLLAFHLIWASREGVSALRIQRELWGENPQTGKLLGSYRTAWFMVRRLRWAITQPPATEALKRHFRGTRQQRQRVAQPRNDVHAGPPEEQALRLLLKVRVTPEMPRPGAHRSKPTLTAVNQELGLAHQRKRTRK